MCISLLVVCVFVYFLVCLHGFVRGIACLLVCVAKDLFLFVFLRLFDCLWLFVVVCGCLWLCARGWVRACVRARVGGWVGVWVKGKPKGTPTFGSPIFSHRSSKWRVTLVVAVPN